jgi:hypothetical protein
MAGKIREISCWRLNEIVTWFVMKHESAFDMVLLLSKFCQMILRSRVQLACRLDYEM